MKGDGETQAPPRPPAHCNNQLTNRLINEQLITDCRRWERSFLLEQLDHRVKDDPTPVLVTDGMVSQAEWWIEQIWMRAEHPAPIPDPLDPKRSHKLVIFPDAAGGKGAPGTGYGAVVWTWPRTFVCHFWPEAIRSGLSVDGEELANKMFFLESVAILAGLLADVDSVRNSGVAVYTDNSACVAGFRKKHSVELLGWSVLKAAEEVAHGLNASLEVLKIRRCSVVGAAAADALSKGDLKAGLDFMELANPEPGFTSRTLLRWLERPVPTRVLGPAILLELQHRGASVLVDFAFTKEIVDLVCWNK